MKYASKDIGRNKWRLCLLLLPLVLTAAVQLSFATTPKDPPATENGQNQIQKPSTPSTPPPRLHHDPFGFSNWDPYVEIQAMREQMDRIFNEFDNRLQMSPFFRENRQPFAIEPDTDIEETDKTYIITMNIPGADKGKIEINLEDNVLNVSAVTMQKYTETKDRNYIRMERSSGSIHRVIPLPAPVDNESMTSSYNDGILTITVKKKA
jgi:HSP20 family protein